MWTILVIAYEWYDAIIEYFKKINIKIKVTKEFSEVITPLLRIYIKRRATENIRGLKPDIIYCDRTGIEELYDEVIFPAGICGVVKPLRDFTKKCYINVEDYYE